MGPSLGYETEFFDYDGYPGGKPAIWNSSSSQIQEKYPDASGVYIGFSGGGDIALHTVYNNHQKGLKVEGIILLDPALYAWDPEKNATTGSWQAKKEYDNYYFAGLIAYFVTNEVPIYIADGLYDENGNSSQLNLTSLSADVVNSPYYKYVETSGHFDTQNLETYRQYYDDALNHLFGPK